MSQSLSKARGSGGERMLVGRAAGLVVVTAIELGFVVSGAGGRVVEPLGIFMSP